MNFRDLTLDRLLFAVRIHLLEKANGVYDGWMASCIMTVVHCAEFCHQSMCGTRRLSIAKNKISGEQKLANYGRKTNINNDRMRDTFRGSSARPHVQYTSWKLQFRPCDMCITLRNIHSALNIVFQRQRIFRRQPSTGPPSRPPLRPHN